MSAIRIKTLIAGVATVGLALSLSACISVFPKAKPSGMYRFGTTPPAASKGPPGAMFGVLKAPTVFTRPSAGDRILTTAPGGEAAYVAGARWIAPASVQFDEALSRAFDADPGRARLIGRGEVAKAQMVLRLEVRTFEAAYVNGPKAAPEVIVQVRGVLSRTGDRALVGDQIFEAKVKAADNRVGPIVAAFDEANAKVIGDLVAWINAAGAGLPASE
ncbi:ABC-type transport auxiliary lipoprotein family protein [Caulobacter endophyticus]|nr:ABC-type transport auxiliary lipoprotein family protein [Caulobacter endophyticus]